VFCKSLLVICSFSFSIVSTFRDCVFSCSDISFCAKQKSGYIFDMKYPYFVSQDYQTFLYILRDNGKRKRTNDKQRFAKHYEKKRAKD
jgi:hypothetical protein